MKSKRIKPELFSLLDDVGLKIAQISFIEEKKRRDILTIIEVRDKLVTFVKNFLLQYFYEGHNFTIESININIINKLNDYNYYPKPKPNHLIQIISQYIDIYKEIMGDPYTRAIRESKKVFCEFLPQLFEAFKIDASRVINNYEEIMGKINKTMEIIKKTCLSIN